MKDKIVIATRASELALWQARFAAKRLEEEHPAIRTELLPVTTKGDKILDRPLAEVEGKGLFIKELEVLLAEGKADLAIHSLKDMTSETPKGLVIAAVTEREDPRDAFLSLRYPCIEDLPAYAKVGTSSLRRKAQLLRRRPDLEIVPLRGNVQTRLRRLDEGDCDGIILATAGLKRLGLIGRVSSFLSVEESIPAVGQGVMAAETREDDEELRACLACLNHEETAYCVAAERAFLKEVGGDCKAPAGAYATLRDGRLALDGFISSPDGKEMYRGSGESGMHDGKSLGRALAARLLADGGRRVLEAL